MKGQHKVGFSFLLIYGGKKLKGLQDLRVFALGISDTFIQILGRERMSWETDISVPQ